MNSKMYNSAMWRSVSTQEAYEVNGGGWVKFITKCGKECGKEIYKWIEGVNWKKVALEIAKEFGLNGLYDLLFDD